MFGLVDGNLLAAAAWRKLGLVRYGHLKQLSEAIATVSVLARHNCRVVPFQYIPATCACCRDSLDARLFDGVAVLLSGMSVFNPGVCPYQHCIVVYFVLNSCVRLPRALRDVLFICRSETKRKPIVAGDLDCLRSHVLRPHVLRSIARELECENVV